LPTDRHKQTKSKYTVDRQIPGAFEGETITRRRLMTGITHGAGAVAAGAFALPALGFALGPLFEKKEVTWQDIGGVNDFPDASYVPVTITLTEGIGQAGRSTAYVRKRNADLDTDKPDEYNEFIAISTACMHLGCPVRYTPAAQRFICPCHGGVYGFKGEVSGGPPVRPLDHFYTRMRNGQVEVGPRYSVNSEFERFPHYRDPAQPLDGVGQYLYPGRFSTPLMDN